MVGVEAFLLLVAMPPKMEPTPKRTLRISVIQAEKTQLDATKRMSERRRGWGAGAIGTAAPPGGGICGMPVGKACVGALA